VRIWKAQRSMAIKSPEIHITFIIQPRHPTAVSGHFSLPDHSTKDIELIPLQLIISDRDSIRNAREGFFKISKGKTLEPCGMNRPDEV